jgi:hypothetical protein
MSLTTAFDLYITSKCKSLTASEPQSAKYEMDRIETVEKGTEDQHSDHSGQFLNWNAILIRSAK